MSRRPTPLPRALVGLVMVASLVALPLARAAGASENWRAGVAGAEITPKTNMWMGGYAARTHASVGTAQPLNAKVLALADGQRGRFVFITVDAIGVTRSLRKNLESRLAA